MAVAFSIATHNVLYKLSPNQIETDIKKTIAAGAEVIGLQEMGGDADRAVVRRFDGWDAFDTGNAEKDPIMWKKSIWTLVEKFTHKMHDRTQVEQGAGPESVNPRWVTAVRLKHIQTGIVVTFGNIHFTPTAMIGGKPRDSRRGRLITTQVRETRNFIRDRQAKGEIVIVTGDLNINYKSDANQQHPDMPYKMWGKALDNWPTFKTIGVPNQGTHGHRYIDWITCSKDDRIRPSHHKIVTIQSDHNALVATFQLTGSSEGGGGGGGGSTTTPGGQPVEGVYTPPTPWSPGTVEAEVTYPDQCF